MGAPPGHCMRRVWQDIEPLYPARLVVLSLLSFPDSSVTQPAKHIVCSEPERIWDGKVKLHAHQKRMARYAK
jgi:hypothetical protein